jgi:glutamine amidotransferase PdxT
LLDKNTDIYVTTLGRRTLAEIKLKKFSGRVLYLVEGKKNEESGEDEVVEGVIIPDGHESTTLDRLPGTLRAIASEIRRGLSKK